MADPAGLSVDADGGMLWLPRDTEPDPVIAYLEACAEKAPNDAAFMLKALGTVARARNMSQLAEAVGMTRAGLYKALSGEGNPSLVNTMKVVKVLGYRLALVPDRN